MGGPRKSKGKARGARGVPEEGPGADQGRSRGGAAHKCSTVLSQVSKLIKGPGRDGTYITFWADCSEGAPPGLPRCVGIPRSLGWSQRGHPRFAWIWACTRRSALMAQKLMLFIAFRPQRAANEPGVTLLGGARGPTGSTGGTQGRPGGIPVAMQGCPGVAQGVPGGSRGCPKDARGIQGGSRASQMKIQRASGGPSEAPGEPNDVPANAR